MASGDNNSERLELSQMDKENKGSPEFKRLYSEENPAVKRQKPSLKKSISWGSRGDAMLNRSVSSQPMTVGVFLVEKSGRLLNLEDGRNTTAGTINGIMAENLSLPPVSSQVFCIWLMSPLLQLQLKDHHRPFRLRKVWSELLKKFTNATEEAAEKDEPILCYQRNSFFPLPEEKRIKDDRVMRRLFEEAKYNILSGNYPITTADALMLGGILVYIDHGHYDASIHTPGFLKANLTDYLPAGVCKSSWSFRGKSPRSALEQKLLRQYEEMSAKVSDLYSCHRKFLEFCWGLPFYGSVFFRGQIERPTSNILSSLWGISDVPVRVAINRDGIHVIDDNKNDILLSLAFEELSWDYTPAPPDDPDSLDTFWLEFDATGDESEASSDAQRLQIFSKQAVMMDAMVQSCVLSEGEGFLQDDKPEGKIRCRMERLSLSTLERTLDRKKKSNLSFSNPFKKGPRQEHQ